MSKRPQERKTQISQTQEMANRTSCIPESMISQNTKDPSSGPEILMKANYNYSQN